VTPKFSPALHPMLIGSMPLTEHPAALELVLECCPKIPNWVQLPSFTIEQMIPQFLAGMPGLRQEQGRQFIDLGDPEFDTELLVFYEQYLVAVEAKDLSGTRFALTPETAGGFFELKRYLAEPSTELVAVKGQITGPVTFATGSKDREGRAIFYDDRARDAAVKLLSLNARWQVEQLALPGVPVIIFVDEPALAGFGSSELISISAEQIHACLADIVETIHAGGGLAGIHVCANTDWALVLGAGVDIVNFDAYNYFDKFSLYATEVKRFIAAGGIVAWGIVPTGDPEEIDRENVALLFERLHSYFATLEVVGVSRQRLQQQSLITPSCGMGSLDVTRVHHILELTRGLSDRMREAAGFSD
jgi:methionine synthase II (cobalamin-independent)